MQKIVTTWNGSAYAGALTTRFVYDGWNLLAELDGDNANAIKCSYMWGLDLSGSLQGAGGVGGLLTVSPAGSGTHFVSFDGNGNVATLTDSSGNISARYEYDPFGQTIRSTGTAADSNPVRFSTKYTDSESTFSYYGYRFYDPVLGSWINRDPIEEDGGPNLLRFNRNDPISLVDINGLAGAPSAPQLGRPIPENERGCCDEPKLKNGEDELRRRYEKAVEDARKLNITPTNPSNPLWPFNQGGNATCKNSSQDVLDYLTPTPPCWQCYLEERNAYSKEQDPLNNKRDHQVVICLGYSSSGAKKEIIFDWWGGQQSPDKFRKEYPYLDKVIENQFWTKCSTNKPNLSPRECLPWQCSRPIKRAP